MANKPILTPLPADLPTNWQTGQTVSPTGTEVGLTQQHGYNYQSQQINNAQTAINTINDAFENVYGDGDTVPVADGGTGAKTPQEALVKLGAASNPNLLDNWYFVGGDSQQGGGQFPINQRGKTRYPGGGYGIDRWLLNSDDTLTVSTTGVTITLGGNNYVMQQLFESPIPSGEVVTVSALFGDGFLAYASGAVGNVISTPIHSNFDFRIEATGDKVSFVSQVQSSSIEIIAAKLELGSVQTLAHQDAEGNWVLNDPPPNFQQELAKCQRYQKRYFYQYTGIGSGFAQSESQAIVLVNNVFMRDELPSISFSGLGLVSSNHSETNAISVSNITPANAMGGMAVVVNTDGGLTKGESLILQIRENDGFFMFDANL